MKKLVIFDLDGTLAESKAIVDSEMFALLVGLLKIVRVAVISGADWPQFEEQMLSLPFPPELLPHLTLLPTCGTKFYEYRDGWQELYSEELGVLDKERIVAALQSVIDILGFRPSESWGKIIEDRGSQITFSALGQQAPLEFKVLWDPDFAKRKGMVMLLMQLIPDFSIRVGGSTSIDITLPGIDKAFGVRKLRDAYGVQEAEMIFIGDAIFPGGNDYPVAQMGLQTIQVKSPYETKRVVEGIIAALCTDEKIVEYLTV